MKNEDAEMAIRLAENEIKRLQLEIARYRKFIENQKSKGGIISNPNGRRGRPISGKILELIEKIKPILKTASHPITPKDILEELSDASIKGEEVRIALHRGKKEGIFASPQPAKWILNTSQF